MAQAGMSSSRARGVRCGRIGQDWGVEKPLSSSPARRIDRAVPGREHGLSRFGKTPGLVQPVEGLVGAEAQVGRVFQRQLTGDPVLFDL